MKGISPRRRRKRWEILIPESIVTGGDSLVEKTMRVGWIGRAAAIFRVEKVTIYMEERNRRAQLFIARVLDYMATPQYARKIRFGIERELRYVGMLPPLRTPNHPVAREVYEGDFREGVVRERKEGKLVIDVGLERLVTMKGKTRPGKLINLRLENKEKWVWRQVDRGEIPWYWGFKVTTFNGTLGKYLEKRRNKETYIIATSKCGKPITSMWRELKREVKDYTNIILLFGGPKRGLREILLSEEVDLEEVSDVVVNTLPGQGVETVRTEEAVLATLAVLNFIMID